MASNYELLYFETHGLGLTARILLSLSGFEWQDRYPKNWKEEEKQASPLGKIPVLTETRSDGTKFVLAESNAINRYLARKAVLFGANDDEAALIDQFYESWREITAKHPGRGQQESDEEKSAERFAKYVETVVKPILTKHEEAISKNGTGYYVGNKVSLVDIYAFNIMSRANDGKTIPKQDFPNLWKLYEKVSSLDAVKAQAERFPFQT